MESRSAARLVQAADDEVHFAPPAGFAFATPARQEPWARGGVAIGKLTTHVVSTSPGGSPAVVEGHMSDGRRFVVEEPPELAASESPGLREDCSERAHPGVAAWVEPTDHLGRLGYAVDARAYAEIAWPPQSTGAAAPQDSLDRFHTGLPAWVQSSLDTLVYAEPAWPPEAADAAAPQDSVSEPTFSPVATRLGLHEDSVSEPTFSPVATRLGLHEASLSEPTFSPASSRRSFIQGSAAESAAGDGPVAPPVGARERPAAAAVERVELTVAMCRNVPNETVGSGLLDSFASFASSAEGDGDSPSPARDHGPARRRGDEPTTPRTLPYGVAPLAARGAPARAWACPACTLENASGRWFCSACGAKAPQQLPPPDPRGCHWTCASCKLDNAGALVACKACGAEGPCEKAIETVAVLPMDLCASVPEDFAPGGPPTWVQVPGPHGPLPVRIPDSAEPGQLLRVRLGPNASYRVALPAGAREGDALTVEPPEGEAVRFRVPPGRRGGDALEVVPRVLMVRVPPGAGPGCLVEFRAFSAPGGRRTAVVPRGLSPGMYFDVPLDRPAMAD